MGTVKREPPPPRPPLCRQCRRRESFTGGLCLWCARRTRRWTTPTNTNTETEGQ